MNQNEIVFLSLDDVLIIHSNQIELYGGSIEIRDLGLLESAINQPFASFDGIHFHESIFDKAAAYLFHICKNHPFVDGNKRVALATSLVFLDLNGFEVSDPNEILYDLVIGIAEGNMKIEEISETLKLLARFSL
ncbi:type II toxin-antitoxin system death-on-curing family toxin [Leptospira bandrabouensis]|uniref:type II toxin-antitoxin system death-on-curing family toxin n=1 Tax=Leptospira bandrabouensis TaxID=2484903 RepID=UPI00223D2199|nr:type II toxin-antitoxin system death-on-curing family toxin [Leptospira bandrabouensis]MCW7487158.1 type II toxin-antitoxin system death-on-curing family toxin [Leptospira bandrabouensis]